MFDLFGGKQIEIVLKEGVLRYMTWFVEKEHF